MVDIEESIEHFEKQCAEICDADGEHDENYCITSCPVRCAIDCMRIVADAKASCGKKGGKKKRGKSRA